MAAAAAVAIFKSSFASALANPIAPRDPLLPLMSLSKLAVAGRWADLPRDLLDSILARLPVPDRLRFPAVCTSWQSAHTAAGIQQATPSPWLMLPFNPTARVGSSVVDDDGDGSCAKRSVARFLSLAEGRAYAIRQPAPAARDRLCVGSSPDGWLVTADASSDLSLLNPVTGAQVRLPPAATLPSVDARRGADGRVESYRLRFSFADDDGGGGCGEEEVLVPSEMLAPDRLRYEVYEKAVVVSAPRRVGNSASEWSGYAVLLICQPLGRLAVARAGDAAWALLDADAPGRCWVDAVRASSSSGADGTRRDHQPVYTMDAAGRVDAWETDASAAPAMPSRAVAPPCVCSARACCAMSAGCRKYLVELSPGRLLQVHRLREAAHARYAWEPRPEHVEYTTTGVELFEWTAATGQWARADGKDGHILGGRALFLGKSASLCVPADDAGVRGGCVYFTDDGPWSHDRCHEVAPDVGVLDLADGSYRPPRGAARDLLWKWPPPVWVFPSLAG